MTKEERIEKFLEDWETGEEMIKFIKENKIYNYAAFFNYCRKNNEKWFKKLCDTPNFRKYFYN